jgi:hypothetical protein
MEIRLGHVISLHKLNINKQDASRGLDLLMGFGDLMINYEKSVLQIVSALSTELGMRQMKQSPCTKSYWFKKRRDTCL